ncbi:MAG: APC family permease [Deinococcus sp.]|nr:APC family permease [Deinococcus sp.]
MLTELKRFLVGRPLSTAQAEEQRLSNAKALAVFASDALSSVAYATEETLLALALAGAGALSLSWPVALAIGTLLVIVVVSYRQTIHAYPSGGGSYIVAKDNLGLYPGLVAGAALMIDYVLTASVSTAAGVAAVTSAIPALYPYRVELSLLCILVITVANLRGVRESGNLFAAPTYLFIGSLLAMIVTGATRILLQGPPLVAPPELFPSQPLTLFLILRAFASGCTALTGVEAISNGVPVFRRPESRNASFTLAVLGAILLTLFLGVTALANTYAIAPRAHETVVSQLARQVFGTSPWYFLVQAATMLILILAANTSFAGFPRLTSLLARDGYLPRQLATLGDRLVFTNGIVILGAMSALLLILFHGDTHALIPLYAVGVFLCFTLSQAGMVRRWFKLRTRGWWHSALMNGVGALATGLVLLVVASVKFTHGAWIVVVLLPMLVLMFLSIKRHYIQIAQQLSLEDYHPPKPFRHTVIIPISGVHKGVINALQYAHSIAPNDITAVYVDLNGDGAEKIRAKWEIWGQGVPLVVLPSPDRSLVAPLLKYIDDVERRRDDDIVTVVLPEFVPARWWQHLLHNQTAWLIKGALLFRRGKVVVSVPYRLEH